MTGWPATWPLWRKSRLCRRGGEREGYTRSRVYASQGKTPLLFVCDGRPAGIIAVADTVRETSRHAIRRLKEMGLTVVMLTGDNKVTAEAIQKELDIAEAVSDVLPNPEGSLRPLLAGERP